jgi:hypothetical protein
MHSGEVAAGVVCDQVLKLHHKAFDGFEKVLAHGIPAGMCRKCEACTTAAARKS